MNILVTGGSRGIGLAIARRLAIVASNLILLSKSSGQQDVAIEELNRLGGAAVHGLLDDLADREAALRIAQKCGAVGGVLDGIVLCAASAGHGEIMSVADEDLLAILEVNLISQIRLVRCLGKDLIKPGSKIIIVGSTASYTAYRPAPIYSITKWGLRGFALNLREEFSSLDVGVTFISPGATMSDMWTDEKPSAARMIDPDDIAKLVSAVFNLSSRSVVDELVLRPMRGNINP